MATSDSSPLSLSDQIASLAPGEWWQLDLTNSFWDVAVSYEEHNALVEETGSDPFWGWNGVRSVLSTWNSAGYDPVDNQWYFFGGGHGDYGGNEVYTLDLDDLTWQRLTDPEPVTMTTTEDGYDIGLPESGPISPHTYDGLTWNESTGTLWLTSTATGFGPSAPSPDQKAVWEFDPATGQWTAHDSETNMRFGTSAYLGDSGDMLSLHNGGWHYVTAYHVAADGTQTDLGVIDGLSFSFMTFTDPSSGQLYTVTDKAIEKLTIADGEVTATKAADLPGLEELNTSFDFRYAGYAYRPTDGKFYIWNGGDKVITWDPATSAFETIWADGPSEPGDAFNGVGRVFEKWQYLEDQDAFVGIADGQDGMWVWKPGQNPSDIDQAKIGTLVQDFNTSGALGVFLPFDGGDRDYDSTATVEYRAAGSSEWSQGPDLLRMRPDLNRASEESPEGYAGTIFGLDPNTDYEVRVTVSDPDGTQGEAVQTLTASTKALPAADPATPTAVDVYDVAGLRNALDTAEAGDVIQVHPGLYTLDYRLTVSASGTQDNPIVIRGLDLSSTVIDAQDDLALAIEGDHVTVEGLNIQNSGGGVKIYDADGITVRGNKIATNNEAYYGQDGISGLGSDIYIADNILEGSFPFGQVDTAGSDRGINVGGSNIEIAYNTISGFLDAIAGGNEKSVGVEIHHNDILWATDNGIELDHGLRNLSVHDNRVANTNDALSAQTVATGPAYFFDNILYNVGNSPLKIKPLDAEQSQGVFFVNNTIIKSGAAWSNDSGVPSQIVAMNNLFAAQGTTDANETLRNLSDHQLLEMDHNAWLTDGVFRLELANQPDVQVGDFATFQNETQFADNSVLLAGEQVFQNLPLDFDVNGSDVFRDAAGVDFSLADGSSAIDAGKLLTGINDDFTGAAPDIGAIESGQAPVVYGARITLDGATAPYAAPDSVATPVGQPVTFDPAANDFDPDGDAMSVTAVTQPASGTAIVNDDGTVTYTPADGFTGDVQFTYTLTDATGETAEGTITIGVTPPNDPPVAGDDGVSVLAGETTAIGADTLLANDSDPNGDALSVSAVAAAAHGSVNLSGGTVSYTPNSGYVGPDSFTYTVTDIYGGTDTATVNVSVLSDGTVVGTDASESLDLSGATAGQTILAKGGHDSVTGSAYADEITGGQGQDVLRGGDGDDLFRVSGSQGIDAVHGGAGQDTLIGSSGDDVIGLSELTSVERIDGGDGFDVIRGSGARDSLDFSQTEVLSIDRIEGAGGPDIIYGSGGADTIVGGAGADRLYGNGGDDTFIVEGDGGLDELDGGAGYDSLIGGDGDDVFGLRELSGIEAIDGGGGTNVIRGSYNRDVYDLSSTVVTNVSLIDGAGSHDIVTGSAGDDAVRGGAGSDWFDGGDGYDTAHFDGAQADYTITETSTGEIQVTALATDEGTDTLVNVEALQFAESRVEYVAPADDTPDDTPDDTGGDAPTAGADTLTTSEDTAASLNPLGNDSFTGAAVIDRVTQAAHGSVTLVDGSTVVYTPEANYAGPDSFDYTLIDGNGQETTGTVSVEVSEVNDAPVANGDTVTTAGATPVTIDVLANDTDVDGDALSVSGVSQPAHGDVAITADGQVTYTPHLETSGEQTFAYTMSDGRGGTATGQVTVGVDASNIIIGTDASERFDQTAADQGMAIMAEGGHDKVVGSAFADTIDGGAGQNVLQGGDGDDWFLYDADNALDSVDGGLGHDTIRGTVGDDTIGLTALTSIETIDGGDGVDRLVGGGGRETFDLSATDLVSVEEIDGGGGADIIIGSAGDDVIRGGAHWDTLSGGAGDDTFLMADESGYDAVDGGEGMDTIQGTDGDDVFGLDSFQNIERIDAGDGLDRLVGTDNRETYDFSGVTLDGLELIDGAGGPDIVVGSAGDDHFRGGKSWDQFDGGNGVDTAYFDLAFENYTVSQTADGLEVAANTGQEKTDTLTNVERLRFSDGVYEDGGFTLMGVTTPTEEMLYGLG